ncbi:SDR family oxidoreductase [Rhizobium sp. KVB221]|uniref:SDR family oxidoreductase n=1 Tax=Rhizobium setariae TaxID=2801340 RepID=A0A936YLI9_9HYPH|nr:SDR family oxidoreductase [Rhizobium setariae]MBL0371763.1 SDR family oxidoreductase [Rhizobium setariae]
MKLMILGAGFSGKAIGRICGSTFDSVGGTTRKQANFTTLEAAGIQPSIFDGTQISGALSEALRDVTHLVQSISPGEDGDGFLKLVPNLKTFMPKLVWAGYLSTIGVYGDHKGAWVDEEAPTTPLSARAKERVVAESQWLDAGARENIAVAVLRLSGIYGPGRNAFVNLSDGTARRLVKKDQVFNRIRCEDIGRVTAFLIERKLGGIYNVTDAEPAPAQDVVEYAARLMGIDVPPDTPFEQAELSPMARSFYAENKRVSNARLRGIGFEFLYPNYRVSLENMWAEQSWKG